MIRNRISVTPVQTGFTPSAANQKAAIERLRKFLPEANDVQVIDDEGVGFSHMGENLHEIRCPACKGEIDRVWWGQAMADDFVSVTYDRSNLDKMLNDAPHRPHKGGAGARQFSFGHMLDKYPLPCCGVHASVDTLDYTPAAAFGVFRIDLENPGARRLGAAQINDIQTALGASVTVIYYSA